MVTANTSEQFPGRAAADAGRQAARDGKTYQDNPHPLSSVAYRGWNIGFQGETARIDAKAKNESEKATLTNQRLAISKATTWDQVETALGVASSSPESYTAWLVWTALKGED